MIHSFRNSVLRMTTSTAEARSESARTPSSAGGGER
jgi:hypothetical protein